MFMYNCTHRHHCCDLIWLIRNITDSPKPYFKHGPILSCCDRPAQLTLATDPPVNEERTVMLVETSKMLVANILPTPAGCVEARPGQPSRAPSTCGRGRWRSLNKFQIKYKLKMNQREESKIRAPTRDQHCCGQAWRRLSLLSGTPPRGGPTRSSSTPAWPLPGASSRMSAWTSSRKDSRPRIGPRCGLWRWKYLCNLILYFFRICHYFKPKGWEEGWR